MSPKISQMLYQSDFSKLNMNYSIFQMNYYPVVPENIDPIKENILILVTVGSDYKSQYFALRIQLRNYDIQQNGTPKGNQGATLAVVQCVNALIPNGSKCADQQTINKFYKQQNNLFILTYQSFVLDMDGNPQPNIQRYTIRIEQSLTYSLNINLLSNYYMIKDNLFTDKAREIEYLSGVQINGQTNTIEYANKIFGQLTSVASFFITLQAQQTKVIMEFPQIVEILAQIGSIIQVLFLIRYIIMLINYDKLWDDLISQTMIFYYPNIAHISYKYNNFNRIQAIYYKKQEIDKDQFLQFKKELRDKIQIKLTYNNMVYEISRLYFLIRELANKEQIKKIHDMGIKLEFTNHELGVISNRSQNSDVNDDMEMISLIKRQQNINQINQELLVQDFSPIHSVE